jgi:hypothetical protein
MKKTQITQRLAILGIAFTFIWSCSQDLNQEQFIPEQELADPTMEQALNAFEQLNIDAGFSINSRKKVDYNYFEIFQNQLFFVPAPGYQAGPAPGWYPGSGEGTATRMGKATSYINQFAQIENGELVTSGAPVTMFFQNELSAFGLTNIADVVSSITIDKKGNSIWIKNVKNTVTPVSDVLSSFDAEILIIGGTGKFKGMEGEGIVKGNFNPQTGKGMSVTLAYLEKEGKKGKDKDKKDRD